MICDYSVLDGQVRRQVVRVDKGGQDKTAQT